jgi:hypothetical protein
MIVRVVGRVVGVAALTVALGAAAYGLLEVGVTHASADERLVARTLSVLQSTRGSGAVITLDGRRLVATCRARHIGNATVSLDDGTELHLWRTHVSRVATSSERELLVREPADLVSAEANLAGSHDLYSRELTATLLGGHVDVQATRLGSRSVYALRLGDGSPLVQLFVERASLLPVAARYVSSTSSGTSDLVAATRLHAGGPSGC